MKYFLLLLTLYPFVGMSQFKAIHFKPTAYYKRFSHKTPPVLKIMPGDTLHSESVDALGFDKTGTRITERGNPLTGPFYIEGAMPGDIVAITLTKVALNRTYATTLEGFIQRCLPKKVIESVEGTNAKLVKWTLDTQTGYAYPQSKHEHLHDFKVPLRPFMGCVGIAAPLEHKEPLSFFAGPYGGNMDFSKVTQGATIYLPVFHPGALLYLGDGHAVQGDGELNGDALETSMDFSLVVKLIKPGKSKIDFPRIENAEHLIAVAMDKTLEEALKKATLGLLEWLQQDYGLSLKEATQVIGTSIHYRIPSLAGPKYEVAAMLEKKVLAGLNKL